MAIKNYILINFRLLKLPQTANKKLRPTTTFGLDWGEVQGEGLY